MAGGGSVLPARERFFYHGMVPEPAQSQDVKRAQVEFHNFASLGEPERAVSVYAAENERRGAMIRAHLPFIGSMTPFLEIGANAGHTSYMLTNEFGAEGFALDISADALRHGSFLMERWALSRAPVRIAGDAVNLPFADGSLRFVMTFQTLSQFMDVESVFREVKRVLAPGGVFLFAEEPLLRLLSLRLYRVPYYNLMKPWERKLFDWGLLGYLVKDVIGAYQEESFGIRQNHTMYLSDWHRLVTNHFDAHEYDVVVPERGWGERIVKRMAVRLDPHGSEWRAARLLGGVMGAVCRKAGEAAPAAAFHRFETFLRCPDCGAALARDAADMLACTSCAYRAANEGGVYNLLGSKDRLDLYPGDRQDIIDCSLPGHEQRLVEGWSDLEGVFGNKYRWIGDRASARLKPVHPGPQRLRIRGSVPPNAFGAGRPSIEVFANGASLGRMPLERAGVFVFEAALPEASEYLVEVAGSPLFEAPPDDRVFSVNLSMLRLV